MRLWFRAQPQQLCGWFPTSLFPSFVGLRTKALVSSSEAGKHIMKQRQALQQYKPCGTKAQTGCKQSVSSPVLKQRFSHPKSLGFRCFPPGPAVSCKGSSLPSSHTKSKQCSHGSSLRGVSCICHQERVKSPMFPCLAPMPQ